VLQCIKYAKIINYKVSIDAVYVYVFNREYLETVFLFKKKKTGAECSGTLSSTSLASECA
jgi:hypothetical protein